jgi:hypothetical protein
MNRKAALVVALLVSVTTMACMGIRLPRVKRLETGPTVTKEILVPLPDGGGARNVEIGMGLGTLDLRPGAENALVEGEVTYNVAELEPVVTVDDDDVRIVQGKLEGFVPELDQMIKNEWDLRLGSTPMALTLNVGAAAAEVALGGLSLTKLIVAQGASDFDLSFSEPNRAEMDTLRLTAGASRMNLSGLANANAESIVFKGGAGSYTLRFDGELRRDVEVSIDGGVGSFVIVVPEGTPAEATFEGAMTDVDAVHEWARTDDGYALGGEGFKISFRITMGVGSLELRNK